MSEELETPILKVNSVEEAKRLAEATGKVVEWEMILPNAQPFQPSLSFFGRLHLRFWLLYKRAYWLTKKAIRRFRR